MIDETISSLSCESLRCDQPRRFALRCTGVGVWPMMTVACRRGLLCPMLSDFSNTMSHYLAHKISHDRPLFTFVLSCLSLCRCICPCLVVGFETCDVRQQHLDPQPFLSKRTYKRQRLQESCVSQSFQVSANHSIEIFEKPSDFKSHQHRMDQNCWA